MAEVWTRGQEQEAAESYESEFASVFAQWCAPVLDLAEVSEGDAVLDVACGTGILARAALERTGSSGRVSGVDITAEMLAVARRLAPAIEWRQAPAEVLPYEDAAFDAVVSQFGLMFFTDRAAALSEMRRVLRPGGRLAVAVWDSLESVPVYTRYVELVRRTFGEEAVAALDAPFALADAEELVALVDGAGFGDVALVSHEAPWIAPSVETFAAAELSGWDGASSLDEAAMANFLAAAAETLAPDVAADGTLTVPLTAHIVAARQRAD